MIVERVQTIVDTIAKECRDRFGDKVTLIWFGSWVKGNAYKESDIDLAIEYHDQLEQTDIIAFRNWLDELPTLYSIDLVDNYESNRRLKAEIERDGKRL